MTPLSELTAIIVKAVPEIMELGDDCRVHITNLDGLDRIVRVANKETMQQIQNNPKIDDYEILGRPITLEDVLIALEKAADSCASEVHPEMAAACYEEGRKNKFMKCLNVWHLGKPLSEQSPETISFLLSLLRV